MMLCGRGNEGSVLCNQVAMYQTVEGMMDLNRQGCAAVDARSQDRGCLDTFQADEGPQRRGSSPIAAPLFADLLANFRPAAVRRLHFRCT